MKKGITCGAYIPVRKDPSNSSEMTSQLLFGETFDVLENGPGSWTLVRNHYDDYKGWIDNSLSCNLSVESSGILDRCVPVILNRRMATLRPVSSAPDLVIPAGSTLYLDPHDDTRIFTGDWYTMERPCKALTGDFKANLETLAGQFLNSPYLWGGKSTFGTDCSGLVQTLFRIMGITIERDTAEQHKEGKTVNMLVESAPGDLVFFDDENGEIVHTGVLLDRGRVLHASGHVRIDPIDHQGIYDKARGSYSHKLRVIKRIK